MVHSRGSFISLGFSSRWKSSAIPGLEIARIAIFPKGWTQKFDMGILLWANFPEGVLSRNCTWICLLDSKFDFLHTIFRTITPDNYPYPPISRPFSKEKHLILLKLGAFYHNLLKIHPTYVIWAPSSLVKTHLSLYQISRNSTPKRQAHLYVYRVMWALPRQNYCQHL